MRVYSCKELGEKIVNVKELLDYVEVDKNLDIKSVLKNKINGNVEYVKIKDEYYSTYCGSFLLLNHLGVDFDKQGLRGLFI